MLCASVCAPAPPTHALAMAVGYRSPADHSLPFDNVLIPTRDGVRLHAWFIKSGRAPRAAPTLVFFHANAGSTCACLCVWICVRV